MFAAIRSFTRISEQLRDFPVMGESVNVAARVEGLTREVPADILATDEVRRYLGERLHLCQMVPASIRGKSAPIVTWALETG
jgi:adenylate cyclase